MRRARGPSAEGRAAEPAPAAGPPAAPPEEGAAAAPARWRTWAALGIVVALAVTLLWLLGTGSGAGPSAGPPAAQGSAQPAPSAPTRSTTATTSTATRPAATPGSQERELVAAARQALDAWARFASSGDLAAVRRFYWPDGPQYRQFQREAAAGQPTGGPAYTYTLSDPAAVVVDGRQVVRGTVTVSRAGERSERFAWDLELRRDPTAGRWRVWAVAVTPAASATTAPAGTTGR